MLTDDVEANCPHCGELIPLGVDPGGGAKQSYIEDCSVCCRPFVVQVFTDEDGQVFVDLQPS